MSYRNQRSIQISAAFATLVCLNAKGCVQIHRPNFPTHCAPTGAYLTAFPPNAPQISNFKFQISNFKFQISNSRIEGLNTLSASWNGQKCMLCENLEISKMQLHCRYCHCHKNIQEYCVYHTKFEVTKDLFFLNSSMALIPIATLQKPSRLFSFFQVHYSNLKNQLAVFRSLS